MKSQEKRVIVLTFDEFQRLFAEIRRTRKQIFNSVEVFLQRFEANRNG